MATFYPQPTYDYPAPPSLRNTGMTQTLLPPASDDLQKATGAVLSTGQQVVQSVVNADRNLRAAASPALPPANNPGEQASVRAIDNNPANAAAIAAAPTVGFDPNAKVMGPPGYLRAVSGVPDATPAAAPAAPDATTPAQPLLGARSATPNADAVLAASNPLNQGAGVIGPADYANRNADFNDRADLRSALNRTRIDRRGNVTVDPAAAVYAGQIAQRQRLSELSLKNASDERIANMHNTTAMRGQDLAANTANLRTAVDARGQDLHADTQRYVADSSARTAANAARIEQMNKDRQYNFDVQKFGAEQAKSNFEQRQSADKNLTEQLQARFRTKDDKGNDVPDTARVAEYKQAVQDHIADTVGRLQQVPQGHPNYTAAQAMIEKINTQGMKALDASDLSKIDSQLEAKNRARSAHSNWNPFGGTFAESRDPSAYDIVGVNKGTLQDQYRLRNGSSVPTRKIDYSRGGSALLPDSFGDVRTSQFENIKDLRNGAR